MTGEVLRGGDVAEVAGAVSQWVQQVGLFLGVVQAALEQSRPSDDATAEVRAMAAQLPALIRECRAQVPTPEMIRTWVQSVSKGPATKVPAEEASAGGPGDTRLPTAAATCAVHS